ncbi:zinc ABC transporter ATP-binding protein AztA [Nocardia amikacinitolerans]|uniref:zinc ABC transporter ATP-binding protein AztA n=1 Tax=Nocardia amikacinitolerans TaxID=756689 RepID=UPI0020A2D61D|nr:zinc ABC transporter ATP-binding protein AztA [Nocardia amikacinitolerans]MCP2275524.1 zinc/manganese transport system ATP-binding protein [Nocardia amikacinitolerans]
MNRADLRLAGLSAGYRGRAALADVTATIPAGRITAVLGHNGSGKSTLLAALAGVLKPLAGTIERPGIRRTAFVVQHSAVPATLPITVRETVAMGRWAHRGPWRRLRRTDRAVIEECLARMDIADLADRRLDTLSGGQRQRALLAQALAQEADLLLLDEPTTGLDAEARQRITDLLEDVVGRGVTVVHATHQRDEALRGGHCLLLENGRLLAEGDPESTIALGSASRSRC